MGIDMEKMRERRTALDNRNGNNREVFLEASGWRNNDSHRSDSRW